MTAEQGPPYGSDPSPCPKARRRMKNELTAAGTPDDTVFQLMNSRHDYEQAVPIMIEWLEHLDERIPADQQEGWRTALLRNLITNHARGNQRAVDAVLAQFY